MLDYLYRKMFGLKIAKANRKEGDLRKLKERRQPHKSQ